MIRCEQCFYRYPPGTLFCDVCGAALSPWNVELDSDLLDSTLPADDLPYTFDEASDVSVPLAPHFPAALHFPTSGLLVDVTDQRAGPAEGRQSGPLASHLGRVGGDEHYSHRRAERVHGADEIVVGVDAAPKCVWVILPDGQTFELTGKAHYLIGRRDPSNNVMPDVDLTNWNGAAAGVSRLHASLYITPIGVFVEDLESRNETMRNNDRLLPRQRYPLKDGDVLHLGTMVLHVQFAQEQVAGAAFG